MILYGHVDGYLKNKQQFRRVAFQRRGRVNWVLENGQELARSPGRIIWAEVTVQIKVWCVSPGMCSSKDLLLPRVNLTVRNSVGGTEWVVKTRSWRVCVPFEGWKGTALFSPCAAFPLSEYSALFVLLVVLHSYNCWTFLVVQLFSKHKWSAQNPNTLVCINFFVYLPLWSVLYWLLIIFLILYISGKY